MMPSQRVPGSRSRAILTRIVRGIEVDDGRLALDVIDKVGPMGNYLAQMHTMDYFRKGEIRVSPLMDKRTSERVRKEGFRPLQVAAKDVVKKILKEHQVAPLEKDAEQEVTRIVREAEKEFLGKA